MEENNSNISQEELAKSNEIVQRLWNYYGNKIVGQKSLGMSIMIAMIANGHVLLESVPGLAKTTAAKVMTDAVACPESCSAVSQEIWQDIS